MNAAATAFLLVALGLASFGQTTQPRPAPVISPAIKADHSATFRLKAPNAKAVYLCGLWMKEPLPLHARR